MTLIKSLTKTRQKYESQSGLGLFKILETEAQDLDWHPTDQHLKLVPYMLDKKNKNYLKNEN